MSTRAAAGSKAISASAASAGKSNSSLVVCPAVVLLQPSSSPDQDGDSTDSLVHFFPDHAAAAKQAKRLQGLLLALCGISTALTGQQVAVVKMGAASQLDIKAAYVHFQGCVLVFCLPGALSDGAARAIATDMAALLQCVLGSLEDWQMKATSETPTRSSSIRTVSEGVEAPGSPSNDVDVIFVSEDLPQSQLRAPLAKKVDFLLDTSFRQLFGSDWRAAALIPMFPLGVPATLQSETARLRGSEALSLLEAASAPPSERLVRASQFEPAKAGCLFHRGALVTSHMTPEETKEVWRVCWALSLFRRTAAHPPLILLQDLHMPLPASPGRAQAGGRPQAGARRKLAMVIVGLGADLLCLLMTPLGLACAADLEGAYELDAAAATLHQLQNSGDISDDCMAPGQTNALLLEVEDPAAALLNQAKSKAHTQLDKPKKLPRAAKSRAAHGSSPVAATASAAATTPQHFQLVYDEALGHLICQQPAEGNANLLADFFSTVAFLRATAQGRRCEPAKPTV
ncbi:hypothetical protein WJX72_003526 [[Myrmecia] bisecta]|uniref:Uncharacterized protein n=1 Tax=[Myrmecia] bisecta TaxID=41462 RepID=A0AAW1PGY2_9CHLO